MKKRIFLIILLAVIVLAAYYFSVAQQRVETPPHEDPQASPFAPEEEGSKAGTAKGTKEFKTTGNVYVDK